MRKQIEANNISEPDRNFGDHDQTRRRLLQSVSAMVSFCAAAPAFATHSVLSDVKDQKQNPVDLPGRVEFRFIDSKSIPGMVTLGQGTIINRSTNDIVVTDISPGMVRTDNGHYDIAAYLTENPVLLASGQQHHFWVRPQHSNSASFENQPVHNRHPHKMHGSLNPSNAQRTRVLARIDNPSIGVAPVEQPFELIITTKIV